MRVNKECEEIWREISGYENYQVSNRGNVRKTLPNGEVRTIKPFQHKDKYLKVEFWKDGKRKKMFVHILLKIVFNISDPNICNHKGGDKKARVLPLIDNVSMPNEEWRDVVGYEGLYQVSNMGRVRAYPLKESDNWRIIKSFCAYKNYQRVNLVDINRVSKQHSVHRLVGFAFIPNPNNYPYINHKDENPLNNKVENLEWCTPKYNANYGTALKRLSEISRNCPKRSKRVGQYDENWLLIKAYPSTQEAHRQTGIYRSGICKAANNSKYSAGGFKWKFI